MGLTIKDINIGDWYYHENQNEVYECVIKHKSYLESNFVYRIQENEYNKNTSAFLWKTHSDSYNLVLANKFNRKRIWNDEIKEIINE